MYSQRELSTVCIHDFLQTFCSILQLNHDVLTIIIEEVFACDALLQFSMTCKYLRQCSMPMLFRTSVVTQTAPLSEKPFPNSLLNYVQNLTLQDVCPDWNATLVVTYPRNAKHTVLRYTEDPLVCGMYDSIVLGDSLRAMPNLHSMTTMCGDEAHHGLPWHVLQAILTVPHLRQFTCHRHLFSPRAVPSQQLILDSPTQLTSFRYMLNTYRSVPRCYEPEKDALAVVLGTHHGTLEQLWLPAESTPLQAMLHLEWPLLRELRLRGEFRGSSQLIHVLGNMPKLRLLKLDFALPRGAYPRPVWPEDLPANYAWPELEDLQVSFPCADDQLYIRLPPTLRRLSLRFFPHRVIHSWCTRWRADWQFPSPSAGQMLRILRRVGCPDLQHLEVEYFQDDEEEQLIQEIVSAFPRLTSLKIIRYRQQESPELDVVNRSFPSVLVCGR
ncbi:hypothetical protein C8Q73DRAFT_660151 [Cubamyces lactineus]|nr:hypothetical protein C8Q73DRAFT_660151 [Cubamyces lactineus]